MSYSCAPASITLDLDHTDDATYDQQALSFYNHHYGHYCCLPLLVFEANSGALVIAVLRPANALPERRTPFYPHHYLLPSGTLPCSQEPGALGPLLTIDS